MLVVRASRAVPLCEIDFLDPLSEMLRFELRRVDKVDLYQGEVRQLLGDLPDETFDMVYLCGHGNQWGLGGDGDDPYASWIQLSTSMCQALKADATLVLGCCDGGLTTVAYDFLEACPRLRHIFGLAGSVLPEELMLALHVILSGVVADLVDGKTAAQRAAAAIGRRVIYCDGDEHRYTDAFAGYTHDRQIYKYTDAVNIDSLDAANPLELEIARLTGWDADDLATEKVAAAIGIAAD